MSDKQESIEKTGSAARFDETAIVTDQPKIKWYRRRLYWTTQERIAHDLVFFAVLIAIAYLLFHFALGISFVNGSSMYPTLQNRQAVFYNRLHRNYEVGDVVSVRMPSGKFYVKRIVAAAGDEVDLRDGALYINGELQKEPYVSGATLAEEGNVTYPLTVEKGKYFILGDNRENSNDSRAFGTIIEERITGKIVFYVGRVR
ncbi:signal peptidase I [Hespellia stercorisuis]|uniref:Signal peptidase I n=1 Tax=Hespellia stercorisuis DSM 15480 TaxID=1121950 RepID=A0A1M6SL56_9FIRM|nr:signal peptidase I [Hespellia stercorisuis]SHK45308.1 signal peptidase I [Hespellia stercorisuis DSM 15480]